MNLIKSCIVFFVLGGLITAQADVQVINLGEENNPPDSSTTTPMLPPAQTQTQPFTNAMTQSLPLDQRISRLETQVNNLVQMNLAQQISQLQQQVQELTGQLQVQQHNLNLLTQQQRNFYQDLDQRINNLNALVTKGTTSANAATNTKATVEKKPSNAIAVTQGQEASYQTAFALLTAKKYNQALSAFQQYIDAYPKGTYVPNAYYWRGEIYSLLNNTKQATAEFNAVVTNYPNSDKVADAKFKLAIIDVQNGNVAAGKKTFQQLIQQYPGTSVARLAKMQLEQLQ